MPVPKRKRSKQRRDKRAANWGIKPVSVSSCQTCQSPVLPHQACSECGYYKGRKVVRTKSDRIQQRTAKYKAVQEKVQAMQAEQESATK